MSTVFAAFKQPYLRYHLCQRSYTSEPSYLPGKSQHLFLDTIHKLQKEECRSLLETPRSEIQYGIVFKFSYGKRIYSKGTSRNPPILNSIYTVKSLLELSRTTCTISGPILSSNMRKCITTQPIAFCFHPRRMQSQNCTIKAHRPLGFSSE